METSNSTNVSEAMVIEILARLPLRSISRFKLVCKTWKLAIESVYFRRLFVSLHQNSSSSWSLLCGKKELINLHGCETWGLPKSLASYFPNTVTGNLCYAASSSGLVLMHRSNEASYVGNPVLQQWLRIPVPPYPYVTIVLGLVMRLDEDGIVLGFKVVKLASLVPRRDESSTCLCLCLYSSETGIWTCKRLHCPRYFTSLSSPMSLNGTLYLSQTSFDLAAQPGALMAHDFYSESDLCRVILLPDHNLNHNRDFKRGLTTSRGSVMYIKTLAQQGDNLLKVWRLMINDSEDESWQILWEIHVPFDDIRYYVPMAMHPFDDNIVYLWSQENNYLVSCNLRRQTYKILGDDDHQDCYINQSICEKYMDRTFRSSSAREYGVLVKLLQFVLPQWMESLPRPPQVDMIDTTSMLFHISSLPRKEEE
ncbi:unnamed protein product [Arabidopsis arenosa]|uniref:F-box domain-containing protein n=1 Tax=Arabidopsis arenosa TaxID=38785 RepID=A0A8S1ZYD5_ARAAE|nr:unnamed protein product [Arabidopsis arenosa]